MVVNIIESIMLGSRKVYLDYQEALWIVPTLDLGNGTATLQLQRVVDDAFPGASPPAVEGRPARTPLVLKSAQRTGRRSVQGCVPTLERGNDQQS